MWGNQLARQWRVIRAIEASPNGLTVAELAKREETRIRSIYRDLEALHAAGFPFFTERVERANRWAFIDTFKFKIPSPFTLTELMSRLAPFSPFSQSVVKLVNAGKARTAYESKTHIEMANRRSAEGEAVTGGPACVVGL